jgi:VIT1/CCC1 family predicted Fe2+/Mn2+ transporter
VAVTTVAVLIGMGLTGFISAQLGGAKLLPAVVRNVFGGTLVMIITYSVGTLIGGTGIG